MTSNFIKAIATAGIGKHIKITKKEKKKKISSTLGKLQHHKSLILFNVIFGLPVIYSIKISPKYINDLR